MFNALAEAISMLRAEERKHMRNYVAEHVAKMLTKEIRWLRTFLKAEVITNAKKGEVIDLPRKRDVA